MPEQAGFKEVPPPALATRFSGNGTMIFLGLAKTGSLTSILRRQHQAEGASADQGCQFAQKNTAIFLKALTKSPD